MALEIYAYKRHAAVVRYTGSDRFVVIPKLYKGVCVTEICPDAFSHNKHLEAVFIPSTLQVIGERAFLGCRKLCYVGTALDTEQYTDLSSLPEDAWPDFSQIDAEDLPDVSVMPDNLKAVEARAFSETGLQGIEFLSNAIELGPRAFEGCSHLLLATFARCERMHLGEQVFMDSALMRFSAPKVRLDPVPAYAFANCRQLMSVQARINAVGTRAFYHCEYLTSLDTPKELRSIGREAFEGCHMLHGIKILQKRPSGDILPFDGFDPFAEFVDPESEDEKALPATPPSVVYEEEPAPAAPILEAPALQNTAGGLLTLQIDYRGTPPKPLANRLQVNLYPRGEDTYHMRIFHSSLLGSVSLYTLPSPRLQSIKPLLNHIMTQNLQIVLHGEQVGSTYIVHDILPDRTTPAGKNISAAFFHTLIDRLNRPIPQQVDVSTLLPPYAMRTMEEYDMLINICRDQLPAWVLLSYEKNKGIAERSTSEISNDERKHAKRALELLMNIDWLPHTVNIPTIEQARKVLDAAFHGMEDVKIRVLEILAQIRRTGSLPKWGIMLDGSAGTGKTSIAKGIALVLSMPLIQLDMSSLGSDPEAVSGSPRMFSNAKPGILLSRMHEVRSSTALLLANEVDKAGAGEDGRSTADILLTILDKTGFYENFLEEVIPTDNLFCIATCNDLSKVSKPLKDRFLIIHLSDYIPSEKKAIFCDHVLPARMADANIRPGQIAVSEEAVDVLVAEYALEPGARDLEQYAERLIGNYCLDTDGATDPCAKRVYTTSDIRNLFGPGKSVVHNFAIHPGEINAAFYHNGKAHFFLLEAAIVPGTGKLEILGPMAEIQKEYCKVAYTCVRNTINPTVCDLSKYDVTIFVPGPIPGGADNHVGFACYAAICSKLMNTNLALNDICFIGGCDLYGSLYFNESDLTPLIRSMKVHGISTVYAPVGTNQLINAKYNNDCNITIVEAPDAKTLFSLAVAQSNRAC